MHPAFSILFFTTLVGTAQGLVVSLAVAALSGVAMAPGFVMIALAVVEALLLAGLAASFLHLGKKMRAWRAVLMWRTSWMSREVIVLPTFIAVVGLWWLQMQGTASTTASVLMPILVLCGAAALWVCTAMIYACLRFIEEWAHPLTVVNFTLIGVSSGSVLACALAAVATETHLLRLTAPLALGSTLLAWAIRVASLRRNAAIKHKSNLQTATGIRGEPLVQKSMGMSAGSFNTREFFHGASHLVLKNVKFAFLLFVFVLPTALMVMALMTQSTWPWLLAVVVQAPGLIAERWFFFAQAKHPQNLYYQVVS